MLSLVFSLLILPGDWFVGGGVSYGASLANTEKKPAVVLGLQLYPFSYQKLGLFYDFQLRNHNFPVARPFSVKEEERAHSFGSVFRFSTGRVQPWLSGGLLFYSVNTAIRLPDKLLVGDRQSRIIPSATAGIKFRVWKNLYEEVGVNLAGTARPPWQFVARTVWRF
ncbi:MAG: hypothetical protein G01um101444_276 [Parcubacteria group bacterium Gr01-1014_44]|nr:MAG: hypothetical protein G01um101444_276 [Parcubacteria group bacterium Gr01-1014_44]